jgi:phosphatidylserine/phosphatidylglycerophosphate/cardiolipin synthase-like enzyme
MQFFLKEYYKPKPSICEVYFFPNAKNEKHLIEMLRTCMKSLDIAIFSLTRDNFAKAVIEVFNRGIKVRVIADDECVKNFGSDVYKLAAAGISCKTDNSAQYHMHNKYAIIDESVIVTGSFNWTSQAISNNQENLLFYQDKDIAQQYTNEFNNLWNSFSTVIDKETALKQIEIEKNKKTNQNKAQK